MFIRTKINLIPKKDRTFETPANLHFLAALYYLDQNNWKKEYSFGRVKTKVNSVIDKMRKKYGEDISYPIIFTKYDETWKELKKMIDKDLLKKTKS
ncbi:MAG: hypothetical protein COA33_010870 [Fluviicola sp.]|nr:hypothetical protein [Fluviicola sp.]